MRKLSWMETGHPVRAAQIARDPEPLRRMARPLSEAVNAGTLTPMRANDLLIAGFCETLLDADKRRG